MRIAYADPPYPGCAHLYKDHADYGGEVDHDELAEHLHNYDGWILHTSVPAAYHVETCLREAGWKFSEPLEGTAGEVRRLVWVKPFAAFKRNVSVAYAHEPVFVKPARKPVVKPGIVYRDWMAQSITLKRGLTGAKPGAVCRWLFEMCGCEPEDELHDLFPGTGAVSETWDGWRSQTRLAV